MNWASNKNTIQTSNHEKKGFSSQAKRFPSHVAVTDSPGPGSYGSVLSAEAVNPSFSKKGTSGFITSQVACGYRDPQRWFPGPDVYNLQSSFINRFDFSTGPSRVFRPPVAVKLQAPRQKTPAPNQYDLRCGDRQRISSVKGTSAFLSKTARDSFYTKKNVPSPCHYEVNNHFIQHSSNAVLSAFKSKTDRIPAAVDNHVPGPGAYSPHQATPPPKRMLLPRGYYLAIAAPPLIGSKDAPMPGPGQYDVGSSGGSSKRPMPTAAFASRTKRLPQHSGAHVTPGPGFYDPLVLSKQSFLYNDSRVWIPA